MSQFVVNSGNAKRLHSPPSTSKFHSPTALESSISPVKKRRKYNFITREPCFVRRKEHKTGCLAAPENQPWPIGSQEPYVTVPQATDLLISPDFNHPRDIFTSVFSFWMRGINLYPERRKKERKERRKRKKEKEEQIPYPVTMCALETFKALDAFEARSDDIVLASYPKCGSNWILHIVRELLSVVSEKKYEYSEFPVLECGDSEKYQRMKLFPSPRIMTTHLHYDKLPGSIIKSKAKFLGEAILILQLIGTSILMMQILSSYYTKT
ncbi:sulfotransferase 6B1 isoform X2 [Lepus europaeus]|uniref:sulfotransferase 6B1 isoform X2 n=1 Tax=Lepus europaeus TaxID=9983 RepID=UPI002B48F4B4|nr:sulfotransferase 6B1 isoform X2 [Lepus europaeus]